MTIEGEALLVRIYIGESDTLTELEWVQAIGLAASWNGQIALIPPSRVTGALDPDAVYVKVIDIAHLAAEPSAAYDAVILINTVYAWQMNEQAAAFLKDNTARQRVILLSTADGEDWESGIPGIDAITSASAPARVPAVSAAVTARLQRILAMPN